MKEVVIYRTDVLKRVAIGALIGIIVLIYLSVRWHYKYLSYQFDGRVDSISYSDKGAAVIMIKGNEYVLDDPWQREFITINKGDSLIKLKNSQKVKLIRPDGEIIIK